MIINGLILAAGFSSRMGSFKMGLDIGGVSMIERTVLNMQSVCDKVVVVSGYKKEIIEKLLSEYKKVRIVENKEYESGMFSSIQTGLRNIDCDRVFIQPGDIPFVSKDVYDALLKGTEDIIIPVYRNRKGHPVFISRNIIKKILSESNDSRLNELFHRYGYKTIEVFDNSINFDIDDPEDYSIVRNKGVKYENI